jgi:hypothetical protein
MQEMNPGAVESLSLVAENALALAKAEVHLGLSHAKAQLALMGRVGFVGLATLLCGQVLLAVTALAPLMLRWISWRQVAICVGVAGASTLLLLVLTRREFLKLRAA